MNTDLNTIRQKGLEALTRELGATGTVLFLRQFESGHGNYTREREESAKDDSVDEIVERIAARKRAGRS